MGYLPIPKTSLANNYVTVSDPDIEIDVLAPNSADIPGTFTTESELTQKNRVEHFLGQPKRNVAET